MVLCALLLSSSVFAGSWVERGVEDRITELGGSTIYWVEYLEDGFKIPHRLICTTTGKLELTLKHKYRFRGNNELGTVNMYMEQDFMHKHPAYTDNKGVHLVIGLSMLSQLVSYDTLYIERKQYRWELNLVGFAETAHKLISECVFNVN